MSIAVKSPHDAPPPASPASDRVARRHRRAAASTSGPARQPARRDASATPASSSFRPPSFAQLDARQKALAYWLTQASIAIDPIIYDQLSRFGLRAEAAARGDRGASRRHRAAATFAKIRELRAALLGQSRQSQRDDGAEVPADVHVRGAAAGGAAGAGERRVHVAVRATCRALDERRRAEKELARLERSASSIRRSSR